MTSWMLARLKRETQAQQLAADEDRLAPLRTTTTSKTYAAYLARVFGFEAPVESAFVATPGFASHLDLGWRSQMRLLRSDLAALGTIDPTRLPSCPIARFSSEIEAFGWAYVIEHSAAGHTELRCHFQRSLPAQLASAGAYLLGGARGASSRLGELGEALDRYASDPASATKIVESAQAGFRVQRQWFRHSVPPRLSRAAR